MIRALHKKVHCSDNGLHNTCLQADVIFFSIHSETHTDLGRLQWYLLQWMNTDYCPTIRDQMYGRTASINGIKKDAGYPNPSNRLLSHNTVRCMRLGGPTQHTRAQGIVKRQQHGNICGLLSMNPVKIHARIYIHTCPQRVLQSLTLGR